MTRRELSEMWTGEKQKISTEEKEEKLRVEYSRVEGLSETETSIETHHLH
jgi:hypothetical protein